MRSRQLGSVPAPAASRARGFNPGQAPNHRGIGVTPPGLDREKPWGIWGAGVRCRLGLLPTPSHKKRLGGQGENASGPSRRRSLIPFQEVGGWVFRERASLPDRSPNRALLPKLTNVAGGSRFSRAAGGA